MSEVTTVTGRGGGCLHIVCCAACVVLMPAQVELDILLPSLAKVDLLEEV